MKRLFLAALFVLPCLALPVLAADTPAPPRPAHVRVTWQQKFAQANDTHDGHLTSEQAKAGYKSLFQHFAEIDSTNKGFVTLEDIKAWHKLKRASRHANQQNPLRHHAFQHSIGAPPAAKASTSQVGPDGTRTTGAPG